MAWTIKPSRGSSEEMKTSTTFQSGDADEENVARSTALPLINKRIHYKKKKSREFEKDINWPFS